MSNPFDLAPWLSQPAASSAIARGEVVSVDEDGMVQVAMPGLAHGLRCQVLNPDGAGVTFSGGDAVLVWRDSEDSGVILGGIGPVTARARSVVDPAEWAGRPETLVLEAKGDIVLRNGQSRIRLGAQGDVEIVCNSFATRSQKLLRLLSPLIKLN